MTVAQWYDILSRAEGGEMTRVQRLPARTLRGRLAAEPCLSRPTITCVLLLLTLSAGTPALAQDLPLAVVGVNIVNPPAVGDTFGPGDMIRATVEFNKSTVLTGEPRLVLQIGDQSRSADLYEAWPGSRRFQFRYFVKASDHDDDGISIPANALRLNGGSIRDSQGNDADLTHEAVPDDPGFKVDGRLDAIPTITGVQHSGRPHVGDTFGLGETLRVSVRFSEPVKVTGEPQLTIQVGAQARQAELHARGFSSGIFVYSVQPSDVDEDGFSVPADALVLNGGSIRDADGNDADLSHDRADSDFKVNGASGAVPTVSRVFFSRNPASQDTYAAGETILVVASFTRQVHVTGSPRLTLQVGEQTRQADHLPALRAAQLLPPGNRFHDPGEGTAVYFQYVVQPSDVDDDGVGVPANALTLNGGSIRAVGDDTDANLDHDGLPDDSRRKVDGSRGDDQAPTILQAGILELPLRGTFGRGDAITPRLTFNEGVTVTGAPRIALQIGANTRYAAFREHWGTTTLLFEYVVEESDRDDNGLSIAADAVDLNGGTIRDNAGNDADLDLGHHAFNDSLFYPVNGQLTPVPALPLAAAGVLLLALLGGGLRRLTR